MLFGCSSAKQQCNNYNHHHHHRHHQYYYFIVIVEGDLKTLLLKQTSFVKRFSILAFILKLAPFNPMAAFFGCTFLKCPARITELLTDILHITFCFVLFQIFFLEKFLAPTNTQFLLITRQTIIQLQNTERWL